MYVLDYLAGRFGSPSDRNAIVTEYRLLCSGELYNSRVLTFDWRKSDATRNLLSDLCPLSVVSRPFDDYPQELSLRVAAPESVIESKGISSIIRRPDDDIARDISALLTLFLRRLITVFAKPLITYPHDPFHRIDESVCPYDWSAPIANHAIPIAWKKKPAQIGWGMGGLESFFDPNPSPLGVDSVALLRKFGAVAQIKHKENFVRAARLYAEAMRLIGEWPDVAYQRLISSIETIASEVCSAPSRQDIIQSKSPLVEHAERKGLAKEDAEELAVFASKDNPWTSRKFRTFIKNMCDDTLWEEDTVFKVPSSFLPTREKFDAALKTISRTRGAALHSGHGYGASVGVGTTSGIPVEAFHESLSGGPDIPPVTWFERVVNLALNRYLEHASGTRARLLRVKI
jgi:hypothetical protein